MRFLENHDTDRFLPSMPKSVDDLYAFKQGVTFLLTIPGIPQLYYGQELLMNGFDTLRTLCVDGITANRERCADYVKNSIGVVTALNPIIGYKNSTKIAKEALATGRGVYDLVLEHGILSKEELDTILKPENMIRPVKLNIKPRK